MQVVTGRMEVLEAETPVGRWRSRRKNTGITPIIRGGGGGIQVIKNCLVNQMDLFVLPSSISSSLSSTSDDGTVMVEMLSLWV